MVRARSASLWKDAKPQRPTRSSDAMPGAGGALASGGGAAGCGCGAVAQATRVSASAAVVTTIVARDMVVAPRTRTITPIVYQSTPKDPHRRHGQERVAVDQTSHTPGHPEWWGYGHASCKRRKPVKDFFGACALLSIRYLLRSPPIHRMSIVEHAFLPPRGRRSRPSRRAEMLILAGLAVFILVAPACAAEHRPGPSEAALIGQIVLLIVAGRLLGEANAADRPAGRHGAAARRHPARTVGARPD